MKIKELKTGYQISIDSKEIVVQMVSTGWQVNEGNTVGIFEISTIVKEIRTILGEKEYSRGSYLKLLKLASYNYHRLKHLYCEKIFKVQKAIFKIALECGRLAKSEYFYESSNHYIQSDIQNYKAAAIAAYFVSRPFVNKTLYLNPYDYSQIDPVKLGGNYASSDYYDPFIGLPQLPIVRCIELMQDWQGLYSPNGVAYRILRRILMTEPNISLFHYGKLFRWYLPKFTSNKIELEFMIAANDRYSKNTSLYSKATEPEILKAYDSISDHCCFKLSPKKVQSAYALINFLDSCPDVNPTGTLGGLIKKAKKWNKKVKQQELEDVLEQNPKGQFETPPWHIKKKKHLRIKFLQSVMELFEEGRDMKNCVFNFVDFALEGIAFFYHLDHLPSGTSATLHFNKVGKLIEAVGPSNTSNTASKIAKRTKLFM